MHPISASLSPAEFLSDEWRCRFRFISTKMKMPHQKKTLFHVATLQPHNTLQYKNSVVTFPINFPQSCIKTRFPHFCLHRRAAGTSEWRFTKADVQHEAAHRCSAGTCRWTAGSFSGGSSLYNTSTRSRLHVVIVSFVRVHKLPDVWRLRGRSRWRFQFPGNQLETLRL